MKFWKIGKDDLTDHEYRELDYGGYDAFDGYYRAENGDAFRLVMDTDGFDGPYDWDEVGEWEGDFASGYGKKDTRHFHSNRELVSKAEDYYYDYDKMEQKYEGDEAVERYLHEHEGYAVVIHHTWRGYSQGDYGESWYCCTAEKAHKEYGNGPQAFKRAKACMMAELEHEWDPWFSGDVYGVLKVDAESGEHDSCWGFIGYESASALLESFTGDDMTEVRGKDIPPFPSVEELEAERAEDSWIKKNAPLLEMAGE